MNIYISGISGTGMGPLALMAKAAGFTVWGSDLAKGAIYDELIEAGIEVKIGPQDGEFLREKLEKKVDWFVYTSALPKTHAELVLAHETGVKCTKRDNFTAFLVSELGLKMVAVAGTHGKTTTTAMIIWAALKLGLPVSYIVGTTLGFAPSGSYKKGDRFFIYEADEYDRNFLKYHPWLAVIPAVSYDHPDIYPTREDYEKAFGQFKSQSEMVIEYDDGRIVGGYESGILYEPEEFELAGEARRIDAALAANAVMRVEFAEYNRKNTIVNYERAHLVNILNDFPGVGRRFEKIADGVYTDYAHHPEEISATMNVAKDEVSLCGKKGIVVVYQPHQNTRQHEVRSGYKDAFIGADKIYWLPTYLTREDPDLPVLTPEDLAGGLENKDVVEVAELGDDLVEKLQKHLNNGYLVVLMTAGPADGWIREKFSK
jgi:UDP-N-acetylmuramate--alanine ligase